MPKWLAGIGFGTLGILLSVWVSWWVANKWTEFSAEWMMFLPFILPFTGFLLGFARVAVRYGDWPIERIETRLLFTAVPALLCAMAAYLSFLMVCVSWNQGHIPPDKAHMGYMIFHPGEVPSLKFRRIQPGIADVETEETWHLPVLVASLPAGFLAFLGSTNRNRFQPF